MRYFKFLIVLCAIAFVCGFGSASTTPPIVIATVNQINDAWSLVAEMTVQSDGTWRAARRKDVWKGQQYRAFAHEDFADLGMAMVNEVKEQAEVPVPMQIKAGGKTTPYWCFYTNGDRVSFRGIDKPIALRAVDKFGAAQFMHSKKIASDLEALVKSDFRNIQTDFPALATHHVADKLIGDFNGDHQKDYVLLLSDGYDSGPAAIVMYVQVGESLKRVPVNCWEKNNEEQGWPGLLFARDVNLDGTEELCVGDETSDSTYPIVYSWSKQGLQKAYEADGELSHGWW